MKLPPPPIEDFNFEMTSMIDIVFLLIAFFMTVTTFATDEKVLIKMPVAPEAKVPKDISNRQYVSIAEDGTLFLGARRSNIEEIKNAVAARATYPEFKGVYLRADAKTPYRNVSEVMKACAEVGIFSIIFGTEQDDS